VAMATIQMKRNYGLSKSKYLTGLQCPKALWINIHRRDLMPPIDASTQAIFDMGHEVGELAQTRFPGGTLISENHFQIPQAEKSTLKAIASDAPSIYEATFTHEGVSVRLDILVRASGSGTDSVWDMVEVKSGTKVKDVNVSDLALQRWVLTGAGLKIRKVYLMHLNRGYMREGELDVNELFTLSEVTGAVAERIEQVPERLAEMHRTLAREEMPERELGPHCREPNDCLLLDYCRQGLPEFSIFDLPRIDWEKTAQLKELGVLAAVDIPEEFPLSEAQRRHLEAAIRGKGIMDRKAIREHLRTLEYPLYYLDFETAMTGLPPFDGLRPYDTLTFQASLHVQAEPGGAVEHFEYLGDGKNDPQPGLVEFLHENIGPDGSVVAYNASYEADRLEEVARRFPEAAADMRAIKSRLWDLIVPFRNRDFVHPKQRGCASMKKVLPIFDPELAYDGMPIGRGDEARIAYERLMGGKVRKKEADNIRKDLLAYCARDTYGMVVILDRLRELV